MLLLARGVSTVVSAGLAVLESTGGGRAVRANLLLLRLSVCALLGVGLRLIVVLLLRLAVGLLMVGRLIRGAIGWSLRGTVTLAGRRGTPLLLALGVLVIGIGHGEK